jgi:hypothetical protein
MSPNAEFVQQSYLGWMLTSLGAYALLLPLAGLLCFLLALVLVASYQVIAASATTPKPSDVAAGISTALLAPLVGMMLMVPGYATAAIGAFIRSLAADAAPGRSPN